MKVNIKIVQGRNEIYVEGDDTEEILKKLDDIQKISERVAGMSSPILPFPLTIPFNIPGNVTQLGNLSPSELIAKTKPRNISDKIVLMIYYLYKNGTQSVNAKDMNNIFKQILEPAPKNWGGMMNNLVTKGKLATTSKKDNVRAWSITRTGIDYVENDLMKRGAPQSQ